LILRDCRSWRTESRLLSQNVADEQALPRFSARGDYVVASHNACNLVHNQPGPGLVFRLVFPGKTEASALQRRTISSQATVRSSDRETSYAPAAGRLAAAMATIWASRRPIRDGAPRSNKRTCRISRSSMCAGGTIVPPMGHNTKNGPARLTSRDVQENSNARSVGAPIGSSFIALIEPAADEFFSPVAGS
jgi:hypothetical protein